MSCVNISITNTTGDVSILNRHVTSLATVSTTTLHLLFSFSLRFLDVCLLFVPRFVTTMTTPAADVSVMHSSFRSSGSSCPSSSSATLFMLVGSNAKVGLGWHWTPCLA